MHSGTDLNGLYAKTNYTCNRMGVWQQGGSGPPCVEPPCGGPVLLMCPANDRYCNSQWVVGPSQYAATCIGGGAYLKSASGSCPASPDGKGCAGKWVENDGRGLPQANPALQVVAFGGR